MSGGLICAAMLPEVFSDHAMKKAPTEEDLTAEDAEDAEDAEAFAKSV